MLGPKTKMSPPFDHFQASDYSFGVMIDVLLQDWNPQNEDYLTSKPRTARKYKHDRRKEQILHFDHSPGKGTSTVCINAGHLTQRTDRKKKCK